MPFYVFSHIVFLFYSHIPIFNKIFNAPGEASVQVLAYNALFFNSIPTFYQILACQLLHWLSRRDSKMAEANSEDKRIVMMSPSLMKLYEVKSLGQSGPEEDFRPITFLNPQECLDMMIDAEADEDLLEEKEEPVEKSVRIERQWGELELRLSFFTKGYTWQ
jgi:hypothetical protein